LVVPIATKVHKVVPYDFKRPNKFNRDHARALQLIGETFSRQFSTVLSTTVRTTTSVSFREVGQLTYDEHVRDIPNPTYLAMVSLEPIPGIALLHVPLPIMMSVIDRLLGGTGNGTAPNRPLTDIELSLAQNLISRTLRELALAFESLAPVEPKLTHQESNPQFTQIAAANDTVVVLAFDIQVAGNSGTLSLCIPFAQIQPILEDASGTQRGSGRSDIDHDAVARAMRIGVEDAAVSVAVRFNVIQLPAGEIVDLRPGDIVPLFHEVSAPLHITIGDEPRFAVKPGRRGRRMACVVTDDALPPPSPRR
jgi:flagellar motor switch protein FliM